MCHLCNTFVKFNVSSRKTKKTVLSVFTITVINFTWCKKTLLSKGQGTVNSELTHVCKHKRFQNLHEKENYDLGPRGGGVLHYITCR